MKFLRIALLFGLALFSNHTLATEIFLETFAPEDASVSTTGWVLLEESYIGIRFSTSESVYLSGTIGRFLGTGTYFSAITSLSSPNGFPTPVPGFLPNDMLAYSERTIIDVLGTPEDHLFDISVTLVPGQYFVFFGSVDQSVGFMPWAEDLSKSNIPLSDYLEYSTANGWFEFEPSGVRIALLASEAPTSIDIDFCTDPNVFNCKKKGVLPVTIFGTGSLDVADIDPDTLQLCLQDLSDCTAGPISWSIADRGDPVSDPGASMCAIDPITGKELDFLNPDGLPDLDASFESRDVADLLGVFCSTPKNVVSEALIIVGSTFDGATFQSVPINNTGIDQLTKKSGKNKPD